MTNPQFNLPEINLDAIFAKVEEAIKPLTDAVSDFFDEDVKVDPTNVNVSEGREELLESLRAEEKRILASEDIDASEKTFALGSLYVTWSNLVR